MRRTVDADREIEHLASLAQATVETAMVIAVEVRCWKSLQRLESVREELGELIRPPATPVPGAGTHFGDSPESPAVDKTCQSCEHYRPSLEGDCYHKGITETASTSTCQHHEVES